MEIEFVKVSGSESWVPVINKTLVHSSVNPEKEATSFVDREWDRLKDMQSVIVFGLGGGFHIAELLKRKNFKIFVIEAEKDLVSAINEKWPDLIKKVDVFVDHPAHQLVSELQKAGAFTDPYAILKHPASVRLKPLFYKTMQQILNDRTLQRLRELAGENNRLCRFFDSLDISRDQILTLPMIEEALIRRGTGLDREALIWLAMRELVV